MKLRAIARSANERLRKSLAIIGHTFTINANGVPMPDLKDLFFFGGLILLGFGLYQVYPPLCFIVVGIIIGVLPLIRKFKL